MAIIKDGKRYEYNIDGDLVPEGSVTLQNMYGDFENRYQPKRKNKDSDWEKSIDRLFDAIDPLKNSSDKDAEIAMEKFFDEN